MKTLVRFLTASLVAALIVGPFSAAATVRDYSTLPVIATVHVYAHGTPKTSRHATWSTDSAHRQQPIR